MNRITVTINFGFGPVESIVDIPDDAGAPDAVARAFDRFKRIAYESIRAAREIREPGRLEALAEKLGHDPTHVDVVDAYRLQTIVTAPAFP